MPATNENLTVIKLTHEQASDLIQGMQPHKPFPSDWKINDDEAVELERILNQVQSDTGYLLSEEDIDMVAGEIGRHDSKTYRFMTKGFTISDDHFFIEEADAIEWFNDNGIQCQSFWEGAQAQAKAKLGGESRWTHWFDESYQYCGIY